MTEVIQPIPARLKNVAVNGHVAGADDIIDDTLGKDQATINSEVTTALGTGGTVDQKIAAALEDVAFIDDSSSSSAVVPSFDPESQTVHVTAQTLSESQKAQVRENIGLGDVDAKISEAVASEASQRAAAVSGVQASVSAETTRAQTAEADRYTKSETYTKEEVHNLITTPSQEYVSVTATAQTTAVTDVLPATGAADTTYRVGNWDGTQYNDSVFSEYAWNGSAYIKLSTKSQIGEVYDISANHADTKYADLEAALGTNGANVPEGIRKGGMSVKFVQSSDNNYVQYYCNSEAFTTDTTEWEKTNLEKEIAQVNLEIGEFLSFPKFVNDSGVLYGSNSKLFLIPKGSRIVIKHTSGNYAYITFLKSFTALTADGYEFATGYSGREIEQGSGNFVLNAPSDANYFWLGSNNIWDSTTSVTFNGEEILNKKITERVNSIHQRMTDIESSVSTLEENSLSQSDLTIEAVSNNIANKEDIIDGYKIINNGDINLDASWKCIKIDVSNISAGSKITFGGFYLGRNGYLVFHTSNDTKIAEDSQAGYDYYFGDPNGRNNPRTVTVPSNAASLYIDVQSDSSPSSPYDNLMVNTGETLLPYDEYKKAITKIDDTELAGNNGELEQRVASLESDVDSLENGFPTLVADLPVSADGSGLNVGDAYISSSTGVITVKLS